MAEQWPSSVVGVQPTTHDQVAWQAYYGGGGDYFRSGYYSYGTWNNAAFGTLSMTAGRAYARPFPIPVRRGFDRIACNVATAAAASSGGVVRLGIYGPGSGVPGALLLDTGTVSSETTGVKEFTISQTVDPGVYWLVIACQVANCSVTAYGAAFDTPYVSQGTSLITTPGSNSYAMNSVTGALPTTFTPSGASNQPTLIGLRAL